MAKNRQNNGKVKTEKLVFKAGDYVYSYFKWSWEKIISINQTHALVENRNGCRYRVEVGKLNLYTGLKS